MNKPVDRCDICGEALEFPPDDDPSCAGDTMVTSKCRHVIQTRSDDYFVFPDTAESQEEKLKKETR